MIAAVLLTCFNRKEKTLSCLYSLQQQSRVDGLELTIFLVDDGSTDGTAGAVASAFPEVNILYGDGNLYWNGGMNLAWKTAVKQDFDFYIWLNDDVSLLTSAFATVFESFATVHSASGADPVIVASFCEMDNHNHAYGGFRVRKSFWGIAKTRILPGNTIIECDTFNGNLVLIPRGVVNNVGLLDDRFSHSFGDIEYGYRCKAHHVPMYIAPGYLGECPRNSVDKSWFDPNATLAERYKRLMRPTGSPPAEYFYSYAKECSYIAAGLALVKLYMRLLFPRFWSKLSQKKAGE